MASNISKSHCKFASYTGHSLFTHRVPSAYLLFTLCHSMLQFGNELEGMQWYDPVVMVSRQ